MEQLLILSLSLSLSTSHQLQAHAPCNAEEEVELLALLKKPHLEVGCVLHTPYIHA